MDGYINGRESQLKTVRKTIARHNARVGLGKGKGETFKLIR